jgi:hypothetical protein
MLQYDEAHTRIKFNTFGVVHDSLIIILAFHGLVTLIPLVFGHFDFLLFGQCTALLKILLGLYVCIACRVLPCSLITDYPALPLANLPQYLLLLLRSDIIIKPLPLQARVELFQPRLASILQIDVVVAVILDDFDGTADEVDIRALLYPVEVDPVDGDVLVASDRGVVLV